ncbi:hypothetical protein [Actinoplanes aureus]|uniref:Uncharacterized protein n=1 Tax=Actinoplanes aureus TaxID=2792083 RepID=A0A931CHW6_9ACTN|nr:hypothetical protein [Actinoplanes aureus]MBG0566463.1 hypothetical protein [Actinoplanes aureus]
MLTTASGCVRLVVETDSSQLPDMTPTCVVIELSATEPIIHEPRVTATHEVVVTGGRAGYSVPIDDSPEKPRITWTKHKVAAVDDVVRWVPAEIKRSFSTGESPGGEQVTEAVSQLGAEDGAFVGYAAIRPVQVDFTGTCADGDSIAGSLISWTEPDVGVVKCAGAFDAEATAGGRLARKKRCGKF